MAALVAISASVGLASTSVAAVSAGDLDARVVRDCAAHRGALAGSYEVAQLRAVYRRMRLAGVQFQNCGQAVASQIAGAGRPRTAAMASLVKDCVEHGGRLTRSYTTARLRRAFTRLAVPVRDETRCPVGIASQANARPGGPKLTPRLVAGTRRPVLDTAATLMRLVPAFAVFQRPAEAADAPPASVLGWADASNRDAKARLRMEVDQARAIGPDGAGMYALPGAGVLCAALDIPGEGAAGTCAPVGDSDRFAPTAITRVPKGVAIWGPVASDHHDVRLLTHDGRWRTATTANNGAYDVLSKVPRLVTYRDGHGVTHYADWTMTLCLPGQPCPRRPDTSDDARRQGPATG